MKKSRKILALLLALTTAGALGAGLVACNGNDDPDSGKQEQPTEAEKLKDGGAVVFTNGSATVELSQYVKANGNAFRATSSDPNVATATVSGSVMTVTAVGEGTATVMVVCGDVQIVFSVVAPKIYYTVTLDGEPVSPEEGEKWEAGASYTLPEAKTSDDSNMEFKGWSVNGETKQPGTAVTVNGNLTITAVFERKAATEVSGHAQSISLNAGKAATFNVSDYITAYGREIAATAPEADFVTVSVQDGVVTLTGVAVGSTTLTLSTEGVTVQIAVQVLSADMPAFENGTIDIDLFTQSSGSFDFVRSEPEGHTYGYVYSLQTQDERVEIDDEGKLTYTPGADYDLEADGDSVAVVVNVAVSIDGADAGSVSFTVTVRLTDTAPAAPVFEDVDETLNPFSEEEAENSYTLALKAEDANFTYEYTIGGTKVTESKKYTAEAEDTVRVTYVYKGNPQKSGSTEFTVKISYDQTLFPALKAESKTESVDLAEVEGGVYLPDLFADFTHTENIASYTVNGTEHSAGTTYSVSNADNTYGETATEVAFTVVATVKKDLGTLTYTYTVNVTDTTAFRMANGGFENGLNGWTGANGSIDRADKYFGRPADHPDGYFEGYPVNNDGQYYKGIDGGTETLVSPSFKVGGSGWITFKFGSARPIEGSTLRNVHLEFYRKDTAGGGTDIKIADVRNVLWEDPNAALKLNDYKLDLSDFKGETVYAKAVDGEDGGDFRSLYFDAFVTYWKEAPTDEKYTDLTAARYFNATARIDLKDTNTVTLNPFLSQGIVTDFALATVDQAGLTADAANPLKLTATKSGVYTVTYQSKGETVFTATVTVENTVETPAFESGKLNVKKGESGTLDLPAPETGSRFAYAYSVTASGASIEGNVLTFDAAELAEGTYPVTVTVAVTDTKWSEDGDIFERSFTVTVTVYGEKITAGDSLDEGQANLAVDVYEIKKGAPDATSKQINFAEYLIIPEEVTVNYTVTRKIGSGEAASVTAENGVYALPFADCDLTPNHVETVAFEVVATNGSDTENLVSFTLTVSVKDTTGNRVRNGDFETGDKTGWTLEFTDGKGEWAGNPVQNNDGYWGGKAAYNKEGVYHFNGQEGGIPENRTWRLTSSSFVLGGSGFITFKMGGHAAVLKVYTVESGTETQVAEYHNTAYADHDVTHVHSGGMQATMTTYVADLSQYIGKEIKLVLCDDMVEDWGHSILDDVVTYYETAPVAEGRYDTVKNLCDDAETVGETCDIPWKNAENKYVNPASEE